MYLIVKSKIALTDYRNVLNHLDPKTYEVDSLDVFVEAGVYKVNLCLYGSHYPEYSFEVFLPMECIGVKAFYVNSIATELLSLFYSPN